jgi:hypothetical protein
MCVPECIYGMIVVKSQEVGMARKQVTQAQPEWSLASILISFFESCYGFGCLLLDDPAGMQA